MPRRYANNWPLPWRRKLAAESEAGANLSKAEERAALLAQTQAELSEQTELASEAQQQQAFAETVDWVPTTIETMPSSSKRIFAASCGSPMVLSI